MAWGSLEDTVAEGWQAGAPRSASPRPQPGPHSRMPTCGTSAYLSGQTAHGLLLRTCWHGLSHSRMSQWEAISEATGLVPPWGSERAWVPEKPEWLDLG